MHFSDMCWTNSYSKFAYSDSETGLYWEDNKKIVKIECYLCYHWIDDLYHCCYQVYNPMHYFYFQTKTFDVVRP